MRSSKSASWRPEWISLTFTGAFKPLYSCCRLHYRWPWRQRHNKTSPIWSPEGDSSTAATASTHSLWLGAPSSGEERVGCAKCWPACVKLCASAVEDSEDSRVTTFQQSARLKSMLLEFSHLSAGYMDQNIQPNFKKDAGWTKRISSSQCFLFSFYILSTSIHCHK